MENTKKLTGKDLINVGIYTAMTLVIFFVVGLLTALPVVYPFLFIIWPIVCGIPMMLYYTKIQKLRVRAMKQDFSWKTKAEQYIHLYQEII